MAQCTSCGLKGVPTKMRVIEHKISGEQRFVCNERCMSQLTAKIGWPVDTNKVTARWRDIAFPPFVRELLARYPELPRDLTIRYAPPTDAKHHPGPVNLADMFGVGDNHTLFVRAPNQSDALVQLQRMGLDAGTAGRGFLSAGFMADMATVPASTAASFDAQMRIVIAEFERLDRGEPSAAPVLTTAAPEKSMPSVKRPAAKKQKEQEKEARRRSPAPASRPGAPSTLVMAPPARRSPAPVPAPMVVDRPSTLVMAPPASAATAGFGNTIAELRATKTMLEHQLYLRTRHVQEEADRRAAVHQESAATYKRIRAEYKEAMARLDAAHKVEQARYAESLEARIKDDERAVGEFNAAVEAINGRMSAIYDQERVEEAAKSKRDEEEFERKQEQKYEQIERRARAKEEKRGREEASARFREQVLRGEEEARRTAARQAEEEAAPREPAQFTRAEIGIADHARPLTSDTFSWYDIPNRRPFSLKDGALEEEGSLRTYAVDQLFKIMTDCVLTRTSADLHFVTERALGTTIQEEFDESSKTKEEFVLGKIKDARGVIKHYLDPTFSDGSNDDDEIQAIRNALRSEVVPPHWKAFFVQVKELYGDRPQGFRDDALLLMFEKFWSYARDIAYDEFPENEEDEDESG